MSLRLVTRIAMSISLLWMLSVTTVATFDFVPELPASGVFLNQVERERTPDELASQTEIDRIADRVMGPPKRWQFDLAAYKRWLLIPVAIFWIIGGVIYFLLRWIAVARP